MNPFQRTLLHAVMFAAMAVACLAIPATDKLKQEFSSPPDTAKPWVYWYWNHCNLTKAGITADLEDMQRRGIKGALIMDTAEAVPMGLVYNSPEYWAMVDFVLQEATRLGLQLNFHNSPSWSGNGGPWVIPEHAMQIVVTSETTVEGPAKLDMALPPPPVTSITVPNRPGPDQTHKYYRDIAVLAFPTPLVDQTPFGEQVAAVTTSGSQQVANSELLFDHNPETSIKLPPAASPYLQFELKKPASVRGLSLKLLRPIDAVKRIEVQGSDDGAAFKKIYAFPPPKNRPGLFVRNPNICSERSDVLFNPISTKFLRVVFEFHAGKDNTVDVADVDFHGGSRITDLGTKAGYLHTIGLPFNPVDVPLEAGMAIGKDSVLDVTKYMQPDGRLNWDAPAGKWTIIRFGCTLVHSTNQEAPIEGRGLESDKLSREASAASWDNGYLKKLMDHAGPLCGKTLVAAHIDSYEEDCQNWTPALREEFTKRRHYDPLPYFPVLTGRIVDSMAVSERFLWDYRRTLADLFNDNWYGYLTEYCHKRGLETTCEPYGCGNFDASEAGSAVDIPSSEFWTVENLTGEEALNIKRPPCSAHTWGKTIVNSEAFTGQNYASKFLGHPYRLKNIGDYAWSLGVNRFVFHTYVAQPWTDPALEPGMAFGPWGTQFGRTVTWWEMGSEWMRYLARSQYLLQQGLFQADVCVFEGENEVPGYGASKREDIKPEIPKGYDFDFCDKNVVLNRMSVKDGRIVLPDGMSYRFLLLKQSPGETAAMTPEVLKKIRSLVEAGATLIGGRPSCAPTLANYPACDTDVKAMADELWGDCDGVKVKERSFGKGKVIQGKSFEEIAESAGLPQDFGYVSNNPKLQLNWIHRNAEGADIYFLANQRIFPADAVCKFRVSGLQPEFWYPDTGRIEVCPQFKQVGKLTEVPIHFDSKGSLFVVFRRPAMADPIVAVRGPAEKPKAELTLVKASLKNPDVQTGEAGINITGKLKPLIVNGALDVAVEQNIGGPWNHRATLNVEYTLDGIASSETFFGFESLHLPVEDAYAAHTPYQVKETAKGLSAFIQTAGTYTFEFASGKTKSVSVEIPAPLAVDGPWEVHFQPNRGAPEKVVFDKLISWPEHENLGVKYFSGTAAYVKKFNVPAALVAKDRRLCLDLGRVEVMAEVTLNGKNLGILWKPPFRMDVTGCIKAGTNALEVKVVNLWPNRLIGDEELPDDCTWVKHFGGMQLKDWPAWLPHGIPNGPPRPATGRVTFMAWKHWNKGDPLLKSGLIGPVTLQTAVKVALP